MSSTVKSLDAFYPIFDSADWLERLVPLGIKIVQLRVKDKTPDEVRHEILRAKEICAKHDCILVVNDYWQLAIELGCDFIHLGQEDLDTADISAIKAAGMRFGLSTHDRAELNRALALKPDYIALGPIYPTILKKMKWHEQGTGKLTRWKDSMGDIPLIAIGGMTIERTKGAFDAGADIVCAVTDITLNASPEARIQQWLAATR
jgi:thiamine-phosphate pyrophosphorylase